MLFCTPTATALLGEVEQVTTSSCWCPFICPEYEVELNIVSRLPPLAPFAGWDTRTSLGPLAWYHAYNQTKHNRERHFDTGTLRHAN